MKKEMEKISKKGKRGQLTIFVILALVIAAVLVVLFFPKIKAIVSGPTAADSIKKCAEDSTREVLEKIKLQGGSLTPENYILYDGNKVEYACYTSEYFKKCVMQKPFLKQDIEQEITNYIEPKVKTCLNDLKSQLEQRGNSVSMGESDIETSIVPNSIIVTVNVPLTITNGGVSSFNKFRADVSSNLYDLVIISSSILNYEARYGDSDIMAYMFNYPDIKIEKNKLDEGTVYILTDKTTNEKFMFASRSIAWPVGYDVESIK